MIDLKEKKILLVEDEEVLRDAIQTHLELCGAKVFVASNGLDGFTQYQDQNPDLIVSDMRMPGEGADGLSLLMKVKKTTQSPPFIIMTGFADISSDSAHLKGVTCILNKPFRFAELETEIKKALKV